jgi:hypothetical protein
VRRFPTVFNGPVAGSGWVHTPKGPERSVANLHSAPQLVQRPSASPEDGDANALTFSPAGDAA